MVLAFPPANVFALAFVALVPLLFTLDRVESRGFWDAFRPGFLAGLSFFTLLVYWIVFLASTEVDNPLMMSGPLALLVVHQSCFWGLFSWSAVHVTRRTRLPGAVVVPVLWTAFEYLRSLGVLGFTWGALGYAGTSAPEWVQFASYTSVFGVTFWIVLINCLVLALVAPRRRRSLGAALALVFGLVLGLVLPPLHGARVVRAGTGGASIRVAVLQPNVPGKKKWDSQFKDLSFDELEDLTREAAAAEPDLIVWPETAAPSYLLRDPVYLARVERAASEAGAPILTGCPDLAYAVGEEGPMRPTNSVLMILGDGSPPAKYDKIHLVPFGEMIPFETVFPPLRRVDLGEADFRPGSERVVFDAPGARTSVLVCFEAIFPRLVREFVDGGAELLVNVTNDVWYGRTSMPFQHASMAVMRSIENRRSLARSANSGVSLLADPHGRVVASTRIFERGYVVSELPVVAEKTFYTRHGDVFSWAVSILAVLMIATPRSKLRQP